MRCTTVLRSRIGTAASSRQPSWRRSISCSNCRIGSRKRSSSCSIRPSISWGSESPTPTHATRIPRRALARRGISRYNEGLKMAYRLLADAVVLLHTAFVAFVVLGGFLAWRWSRIAWLHVPCALWGAVIEYQGWVCPLTPLENDLRRRAGGGGAARDRSRARRRRPRRRLLAPGPAGVHPRPHAHQPEQRRREPEPTRGAGSDAALPRLLQHGTGVHDVADSRAGDRGGAAPPRGELPLRA